MKLHELRSPAGARKESRRVGRGTGSGRGKTSGRGQKGQLARSEGFRLGFEGGQMPLAQRLPKLGGFKNPFKKRYAVVNLTKLNRFKDGTEVTEELIWEAGLARQGEDVKVLGTGNLGRKLKSVEAHAFSESARAALEQKGVALVLLEEVTAQPGPSEEPAPVAGSAAAGNPLGHTASEPAESAEDEANTTQE